MLAIKVHNAKNLIAGDTSGKSDPYCVVQYRKEKQKTETVKQTLNPVWEEILFFSVPSDFTTTPEETGEDALKLFVWDWDMGPQKDDFLGVTPIPNWKEAVVQSPGKPFHWFGMLDQVDQGEIFISIVYSLESKETLLASLQNLKFPEVKTLKNTQPMSKKAEKLLGDVHKEKLGKKLGLDDKEVGLAVSAGEATQIEVQFEQNQKSSLCKTAHGDKKVLDLMGRSEEINAKLGDMLGVDGKTIKGATSPRGTPK